MTALQPPHQSEQNLVHEAASKDTASPSEDPGTRTRRNASKDDARTKPDEALSDALAIYEHWNFKYTDNEASSGAPPLLVYRDSCLL
jgi:hypothetical protein